MIAVFQSSSLQITFQCFQHGKQAAMQEWQVEGSNAATEWKPCTAHLSDVSNLPLHTALRGKSSTQDHLTVGQKKERWVDLWSVRSATFLFPVVKAVRPTKQMLEWELVTFLDNSCFPLLTYGDCWLWDAIRAMLSKAGMLLSWLFAFRCLSSY